MSFSNFKISMSTEKTSAQ